MNSSTVQERKSQANAGAPVRRTSRILILFLLFVLILIHLSFYIEETVDCRLFVPVLLWS